MADRQIKVRRLDESSSDDSFSEESAIEDSSSDESYICGEASSLSRYDNAIPLDPIFQPWNDSKEEQERLEKQNVEQANKLQLLMKKQSDIHKSHEVEDEEDIKPLEHSRLHLLNDDCLCEIFNKLSIIDLSRLSQLDKDFQVLIQQRVIGKKLVNINSITNLPDWFTNRILKQFGQHFCKIKVESQYVYDDHLSPFERFLTLITKNCAAHTFKDVELKFNYGHLSNRYIAPLSIPYFTNVHRLVIRDFMINEIDVDFFKPLAKNAKHLEVLTLDDVQTSERSEFFNFDLSEFLESKPKLRMFSYRGNEDISPMMVDALKQKCTNLKTYVHILLRNPYRSLNTISDEMKNRYNYLCEISNLTNVTITSHTLCGSDLSYPLQKLAAKNQLESLKVYINIENAIELVENERFINERLSFSSLRNIDIKIESHAMDGLELKMNFLFNFMSKLQSLNQVRIIGQRIENICHILDMVPNIRVLCLSQISMKYLPVEMKKIVQSATKIRKRQLELGEDKPLLHLNLNLQQWREVQVHKNIENILTSDIDRTSCFGFRR